MWTTAKAGTNKGCGPNLSPVVKDKKGLTRCWRKKRDDDIKGTQRLRTRGKQV